MGWQAQQGQDAGVETKVSRRERMVDSGEKLDLSSLSIESVQRRLTEIVKLTVDIEDDEEVELDKPLMQIGVTSKSAVALRNALSTELPGMTMPFTLVFDFPTVNSMSELIMEQSGR